MSMYYNYVHNLYVTAALRWDLDVDDEDLPLKQPKKNKTPKMSSF